MNNEIIKDDKLYDVMRTAMNTLANAVKVTLGPKGKNVIIFKDSKYYTTKDGVSVAKAVYSTDQAVDIIMTLIKEIAIKTNKEVGDGTTTAITLAQAALKEALVQLSSGRSSIDIQRELSTTINEIYQYLDEMATPITIDNSLYNVALISANGNKEIASYVFEAYKEAGVHGIIDIRESANNESSITKISGYTFDRGVASENFINDNDQKLILEKAEILLIDGKLLNLKTVTNVLEQSLMSDKSLVIIAEDFGEDVLKILERNNYTNLNKFIPVKIPGVRFEKKELLKDLAVYLGIDLFSSINSTNIIGSTDTIIIDRKNTTIQKSDNQSDLRIKQLTKQIENETDQYKIQKIKERIDMLSGHLSIIHVGGFSDLGRDELIDRVEDAVNAAKSALDGGIVPGAGVALKDIALAHYSNNELISNILLSPYFQILENADTNMRMDTEVGSGVDYNTGELINVKEHNIIDPVKVTKEALKNAFAVVSMLISTNVLILDKNDKLFNSYK